jgi:glycerol-3-phosphate O-acyltransferase
VKGSYANSNEAAALRVEAAGYLNEMSATHQERSTSAWRGCGRWILHAYDVHVDEDKFARLRQLDRRHTLIFVCSHRSYLDARVLPEAMASQQIGPAFGFGGANLSFFLVLATRSLSVMTLARSRSVLGVFGVRLSGQSQTGTCCVWRYAREL